MQPTPPPASRPWGSFQTCAFLPGQGCLKVLRVDPLQRLSLQRHAGRTEHWIALSGAGMAEVGGQRTRVQRGDSLVVSRGEWHRLWNDSETEQLVVAEVQVADYGSAHEGEEDIERREDDYGRVEGPQSPSSSPRGRRLVHPEEGRTGRVRPSSPASHGVPGESRGEQWGIEDKVVAQIAKDGVVTQFA